MHLPPDQPVYVALVPFQRNPRTHRRLIPDCCFIVHRYGTQLTEEQIFRGNSHAMGQTYAAKDAPQGYYPHTPLNNVPGRQGYYEYPYAQKEHGFGGSNH